MNAGRTIGGPGGDGVTGSTAADRLPVAVRDGLSARSRRLVAIRPPAVLTGRYARWQPSDGLPLRTTVGLPTSRHRTFVHEGVYVGPEISEIAPHGLRHVDELEQFRPLYRERLDTAAETIERKIRELQEYHGDVVVLCWCDIGKPGTWCHRREFARWWSDRTSEHVEELHNPRPASLFD